MYCTQCGKPNEPNARFCEHCGARMGGGTKSAVEAAPESSSPIRPTVQPVIVTPTKSVGIAILLTILFGPLGMLYSTVGGAIVMIIVSLLIGLVTLGLSLLITWPISIIWGAVAAGSYNKKLIAQAQSVANTVSQR